MLDSPAVEKESQVLGCRIRVPDSRLSHFCRIRVPGSPLSHTSVSVHFIIALKKCLADQTKRVSLALMVSSSSIPSDMHRLHAIRAVSGDSHSPTEISGFGFGTHMVSLASLATDGACGTADGSSRCHRLLKMSSAFHKLRKTIQRHSCQQQRQRSKAQLPAKPTDKASSKAQAETQRHFSFCLRQSAEQVPLPGKRQVVHQKHWDTVA